MQLSRVHMAFSLFFIIEEIEVMVLKQRSGCV